MIFPRPAYLKCLAHLNCEKKHAVIYFIHAYFYSRKSERADRMKKISRRAAALSFILLFSAINSPSAVSFTAPAVGGAAPFRVVDLDAACEIPGDLTFNAYKFPPETEASYEVRHAGGRAAEFSELTEAEAYAAPLTGACVIKKGILWTGDFDEPPKDPRPDESLDAPELGLGSFSVFQNSQLLNHFDSYCEAVAYARAWPGGVVAGEMVVSHTFAPTPEHKLYLIEDYKAFGTLAEAVSFAGDSDIRRAVIAVCPEYDRSKILWENAAARGVAMIENVPFLCQFPELPRGCEVTALTMLLNFKGLMVDKTFVAKDIKKSPLKYDDPNNGFIGDMYSLANHGLGAYHTPVAELARGYVPREVIDVTGCEFEDLFYYLDRGMPVWVIVNSRYAVLPEYEFVTWQTRCGPVRVTYRMHSVLVTGYDERYVYFHDPYTGAQNKQPRGSFAGGWKQMGSQAITIL